MAKKKPSKRKTTNKRPPKKSRKRLASERFKSKSRFYRGTDIDHPFDAVISSVTEEVLGEREVLVHPGGVLRGAGRQREREADARDADEEARVLHASRIGRPIRQLESELPPGGDARVPFG